MQGITFYFNWEVQLMEFLQAHLGTAGSFIANLCSAFGEEIILILFLGFIYWCYDKKMGRYIGINIVTGLVWNPMIKNLILRRRPYFDHPEIKSLRPVDKQADLFDITAQGYSFPSGHSTNAVLMYGSILWYKRQNHIFKILGILLPFLVGFSRILTGNHYPTDVICGWLLGVLVIFLLSILQKVIRDQKLLYGLIFLVSLTGCFYCTSTDYYTCLGIMAGFFAADLFEERFVKFEPTRNPLECILRITGGLLIFIVLNVLLKLPFSKEILDGTNALAYFVRFMRYMITIFMMIGIYPLSFRLKSLLLQQNRSS